MQKIFNLGCKLNQYEGFCLLKKYADIKDVVIVNTCCVTKAAEAKSFKKFRSALKKYPNSEIIATGCACRVYPEKFSEADKVIDNVQRNFVIKGILPEPNKSRFFLKIQDGCNEACSYCIVSKVRDKIESKTVDEVKLEIDWAKSLGYKEIVLVGANIGLYGVDTGYDLITLLKDISTMPDLPRIRLSSIEPRFVDSELVKILKDLPLCRHFHIPIQSGDNHVLSVMQRGYDTAYLEKMFELISRNFSDVAIGADLIVGFPREGENEFQNTYAFVEDQPLTHLHIFPYSPRPGTQAYESGDPVLPKKKKRRLWELKRMIAEKNYQFRRGLNDKQFDIIIEDDKKNTYGLTDNYIRVYIDEGYSNSNFLRVEISHVAVDKTFGRVVEVY